ASVENALEDVAHLEVVPGDRIASREPELMRLSRSLMPRIPFDRLDVLVVDYLGKDISGMGMDPNVTGRYAVRHIVDPRNRKKLAVLRLTELTHGNACGRGQPSLRALGEPCEMPFTADGRLADLPAPRSAHGRTPWT